MNQLNDQHQFTETVNWRNGDSPIAWNHLCAWCIETYGLPGERWSFHTTEDWMIFAFKQETDLIFFKLRL